MFRLNLVGAQSRLGQCRGSLQGVRHECQGLVNWYQSVPGQNYILCYTHSPNVPDIETTKRKLFSCEADLKSRDKELARNSNVSILKAKYTKEKLVAKKLAFKVRNIFCRMGR